MTSDAAESASANGWGWICRGCAGAILWGPRESPFASTPVEGRCDCCRKVGPGRREWRPVPAGILAPALTVADLDKRLAARPAVEKPAPAPMPAQLSLF